MQKRWIPFFVFAFLCILFIPSFDFATSVVPGWHTTIFPPLFVATLPLLVILLAITIGYAVLAKRTGIFHYRFFIIHLLLTLPAVIIARAPSLFLPVFGEEIELVEQQLTFTKMLLVTTTILFMTGQALFAVYFFRVILSKHKA